MKLALLDADADALLLVRWAVEQGGHEIVAAYDSDPHVAELSQLAPQVRLNERWEALVLGSSVDAVVVGRGKMKLSEEGIDPAERRADQLRKLVQAAIPMIVVCPACEAIVGFEIEMIRRDTKGVIIPYVPGSAHPAILRLEAMTTWRDGSLLGPIEQISLEREQADRSRGAILTRLARDATLLRKLIGTIQTVSASGPPTTVGRDPLGPKPKELPSLANLSVHLGGDQGLSAHWSVGPAFRGDAGRLTVIGQQNKAILNMNAAGDWLLQLSGDSSTTESLGNLPDTEQAFTQLQSAIAGDASYDDSAWLAACRDQEAAEAVDRSLARGRTIELFNEEHTEEESFKGIMAMGGCLLLVMALAVVFLATIVEGLQLPMRNWPVWRLWPFYLLAPIVAFLLLQLLQLAIKRDDGELQRFMGQHEPGS